MAVVAFVLVQTETGRAFSVAGSVRGVEGVIAADTVTGPYDVIAKIQAATLDDVARLVVSKIQAVDGVTRTYTCPVFEL
jgi:DNA-binding Lrp family transcriptional regulator